jgi:hypothetical protein
MLNYKRNLIAVAALVACGWVASATADTVDSGFEGSGNTEGWTGIGALLSQADDPDEGGVLQVTPDAPPEGGTEVVLEAPSTFLGDMLSFDGGSLSFRTNIFEAMETILTTTITGQNGGVATVTFDGTNTPPSVWQTLSAPLSASEWGVTNQENWENILRDVQSITFGFVAPTQTAIAFDDIIFSTGNGASDQAPVPEPGTMVLLGTGLLGMLAYRQRQKA